ncbi:MAG: hypothetical protein LUE17_16785 [Planctomycetaceae bacterium]|nr:hypothetical protein [Planctomycetaceae bacterium]
MSKSRGNQSSSSSNSKSSNKSSNSGGSRSRSEAASERCRDDMGRFESCDNQSSSNKKSSK